MPCFVSQREDVVQYAGLVVHHDVRVTIIRAVAERATLFPLVGITVTPTTAETFPQRFTVFSSQRLQGLADDVNGLVPAVLNFQITQNWNVRVVVMDRVQFHFASPQVVIAMQGRQILSDRGDQVVIDTGRHFVRK